MTFEKFAKVMKARVDHCTRILIGKNTEYARGGDKLNNFKKAGGCQGISPEAALKGMWVKHVVSICDFIDDIDRGIHHTQDKWDEKINDSINYLFLLDGLLKERYEEKQSSDAVTK